MPITKTNEKQFKEVAYSLLMAGVKSTQLPFVLAQIALETGWLTSRVKSTDNNLSGIKWINKPTIQKNASKGSLSPEGDYYAKFKTVKDWAIDMVRVLSRGANALDETTATDFVDDLITNKYFTGSKADYIKAVDSITNKHMNPFVTTLLSKINPFTALYQAVKLSL